MQVIDWYNIVCTDHASKLGNLGFIQKYIGLTSGKFFLLYLRYLKGFRYNSNS